ncbi:hypothetical protein ARMSODRAFT_953783 [Armillaria solidipes]|uniref:Uncharacterized protein n=1 Tax=Armillaria solidipes TaxID=1076256 RepID=A0A2H3BMH9_9AGAR|nr:hypothetical protein ARMSODRAFT_953783 [Armillaria solidipes]
MANPIAKGGGKSNSKSSDKSSGTQSVSINSIPSSTTNAIYYGNNSRCYRDYLHAIEIPCPHHRLSKGATAGITAGCILAVLLILAYYFKEKIMEFIKQKRGAKEPEDSAMEPLNKADS